jgi:hypothetical protein
VLEEGDALAAVAMAHPYQKAEHNSDYLHPEEGEVGFDEIPNQGHKFNDFRYAREGWGLAQGTRCWNLSIQFWRLWVHVCAY